MLINYIPYAITMNKLATIHNMKDIEFKVEW